MLLNLLDINSLSHFVMNHMHGLTLTCLKESSGAHDIYFFTDVTYQNFEKETKELILQCKAIRKISNTQLLTKNHEEKEKEAFKSIKYKPEDHTLLIVEFSKIII